MAKSKPKTTKTQPQKPKTDNWSAAKTLIQGQKTLAKGVEIIDACLDRCRTMLAEGEEYDDKLASHVAWVTKYMAGSLSELRQLEKHEQRMVDDMTPEELHRVVVAYVHELDPDGRQVFRELLDECEGQESLLG